MRDIRPQTLGRIILFLEALPNNVKLLLEHATLLANLSLGIKVTVLTAQGNLLQMLLKYKSATHEIRNMANKIVLGAWGHKAWERRIILHRILIKQRELNFTKYKWGRASARIQRILGYEHYAQWNAIKKSEINWLWLEQKKQKSEKLHWLTRDPHTHVEGIPNQDSELLRICGDQQDEGLILGGIQVNEDIRAFLRLDPKFKVFENLSMRVLETEIKTTAYKQRMS